jgi:serralysin
VTRTFSTLPGRVPTAFIGTLNLKITASDGTDSVSDTFTLKGIQNTTIGTNVANAIIGSGVADLLVGGMGQDQFKFDQGSISGPGILLPDTISDFAVGIDKIALSQLAFTLASAVGGALNSSEFATVTTDAAARSSGAVIVYNSTSGSLFYNQNRSAGGFGAGGQFATLTGNPDISASDFEVV